VKDLKNMNKTLYVTDLDGTLMRGDKSVSERSISIINKLIEEGMNFTVASARSVSSLQHIVKPLDISIPLVVRNGTALAAPGTLEIMEKAVFTKEEVSSIREILTDLPVYGFTSIWHGGEMEKVFYAGEHSLGITKYLEEHEGEKGLKIVSDIDELWAGDVGYITMIDDRDVLRPVYEKVKDSSGWEAVFQQDSYDEEYWLEICPENSTKAKAIVRLKEKLGLEKIVVFGDSVNDIPMFQVADEAYAVENALPELKKYATAVIGSNEEDGVAEYLQQLYDRRF
jgi:HAD-superfamily hydrolase, subfamily IIB